MTDPLKVLYQRVQKADQERKSWRQTAGRLRASLYDKQLAFMDMQKSKKLAVCSRRAGKTNLAAKWMLIDAFTSEGVIIPYITLSIKNAKRIIWPTLEELNREFSLELDFKRTELTVTLPNRSQIWMCGLAEPDDMEKLRGQRYPLVILDECQSMRAYLSNCIEDVLEPATLDYGLDAQIVMLGTPNASSTGYLYECDRFSSAWGKAHWGMLDNPFLPHAKEWLEKKTLENGWLPDTPILLREYHGKWIRDSDSLVYDFSKERHISRQMPSIEECNLVLGVDLGFNDDCSFTVIGFKPDEKKAFILESYKKKGLITDDIAQNIMDLEKKYLVKGSDTAFIRKVADTGGLGKMIVEEMNRRFGLGLYPAEKKSKLEFIQLLNADFKLDRVAINPMGCSGLIEELELLEWDVKQMEKGRYIEADVCDNHCTDSMLYAWRECYHYLSHAVHKVVQYSEEWWKKQEDDMEKELSEEVAGKDQYWETGFGNTGIDEGSGFYN